MTHALEATGGSGTGDYHGQPTTRIASEHLWLDVLSEAGPRIIRLGLIGSDDNVLAETPDVGWSTPLGRYELFGGHRLWFAPEDPSLVAVPDSHGVGITPTESGVRLDGAAEPGTGLIRSIAVRMDPGSAAIDLRHQLSNAGPEPLDLAPWSITQLPLGGIARLPQPPVSSDHDVRPNRLVVLWPYTSWQDARLMLEDDNLSVRGAAGPPMKIGAFVPGGRISYSRGGVTLTSCFEPVFPSSYPDLGSNVEIYVDDNFLELEILGPLTRLAPGDSVTLDERWELTFSKDSY